MSTTLFGERLKREREMRGVSLQEIEGATWIKIKYLEALENENWPQLPGGAFNRGFIRTVARYLGMDEDAFWPSTHSRKTIRRRLQFGSSVWKSGRRSGRAV